MFRAASHDKTDPASVPLSPGELRTSGGGAQQKKEDVIKTETTAPSTFPGALV